jgi:hypothetical protein
MKTRFDIPPEQYASTLREMLRHENDLTNHRLMWLLIGQGFIANAYLNIAVAGSTARLVLSLFGILLTLSAFFLLYKSYQARGYIEFLGHKAKKGALQEEFLPLKGWPRRRLPGWWKDVWRSPWLAKSADIFEPWMFLPCVFMFTWTAGFLHSFGIPDAFIVLFLSTILTTTTFASYCLVMVWTQDKEMKRIEEQEDVSKEDSSKGSPPRLGAA